MGEVIDLFSHTKDHPITWPEFCAAVDKEETVRSTVLAYKEIAGITSRKVAVPEIRMFRSEGDSPFGSLHLITGTDDRIESHEKFPQALQAAGLRRQVALNLAASSVVGVVVFNKDNLADRSDRKRAVIEEVRVHPFELNSPQAWGDEAFVQIRDERVQSIHTVTHRAAACIALKATTHDPLIIEESPLPLHIAALTDPLRSDDLKIAVAIGHSVY